LSSLRYHDKKKKKGIFTTSFKEASNKTEDQSTFQKRKGRERNDTQKRRGKRDPFKRKNKTPTSFIEKGKLSEGEVS